MDGGQAFLTKGMEIVKQAVIADNAEELEKALSLYKQGMSHFVTALKYMKNERSKQAVREKMAEYMKRAEDIKNSLQKKPAKKLVTAGGGAREVKGGSGSGDDDKKEGDEEEDKEAAKLEKSLAGAIVRETPNVQWDDVAGLESAKALLKEAVILPIKFPQLFTGKRRPWQGILLYGPPGTGKSYLAKAVATEAKSTFLSVSSSDLVSKFQGESERLVKHLFELARKHTPSIIFIDEIDSLCGSRSEGENESARRIKTEFLVQMQGVGKGNAGVLVLGATNTPWELDPAIRRRFEKRVYIPLPEAPARKAMFKIHIGNTPNNLDEECFNRLAEKTEGFSGSDISVVVRDALYEPVRTCQMATHFKKVVDREGKLPFLWEPCSPGDAAAEEKDLMSIDSEQLRPIDVNYDHFLAAVANSKPTVGPDDLIRQEEWTKQFGSEGS